MITPSISPWERRLVNQALEALDGHTHFEPVTAGQEELHQAYGACEQITAKHSRTFYLASALLPEEKRKAARALYAFCRISDDLVDKGQGNLAAWRKEVMARRSHSHDPVILAWSDTRARFQIPERYAEELLEGVSRDMEQHRYQTFEELSAYCYSVASTVGLMSMHITGYSGAEAIPYAVKLGVALQLTNILRDVGEDWRAGRLYLPLQELQEFGLREEDIASGCTDRRWQKFMGFQIQRVQSLYAEAMPGISLLHADGRFAIRAAAELYQAILKDIVAHAGDVFSRRAGVSAVGKLRRLPGIWLRSRKTRLASAT